jgi:hypothetical protein
MSKKKNFMTNTGWKGSKVAELLPGDMEIFLICLEWVVEVVRKPKKLKKENLSLKNSK